MISSTGSIFSCASRYCAEEKALLPVASEGIHKGLSDAKGFLFLSVATVGEAVGKQGLESTSLRHTFTMRGDFSALPGNPAGLWMSTTSSSVASI